MKLERITRIRPRTVIVCEAEEFSYSYSSIDGKIRINIDNDDDYHKYRYVLYVSLEKLKEAVKFAENCKASTNSRSQPLTIFHPER